MAKNGFKVVDSDLHVVEPPDLWQRYISPEFRDRAPIGIEGGLGVQVAGRIMARARPYSKGYVAGIQNNKLRDKERYSFAAERKWDPTSFIEAMEMEGVDMSVMFPSRGLFVLGFDSKEAAGTEGIDADFAAAIARAYNDWLHDWCNEYPERLYGVAMVAPHDVTSAVEETRRCVEKYGFKGIFLLPGQVSKRQWHDAYYDPLWAECERLDIPVGFHSGGWDYLNPAFGHQAFDWWMTSHTFSHSLGPMFACADMTAGGVFERFPKLIASFLEANCSWAPWLLGRLDDHFEWAGYLENPELTMKPSEYFKRNCYVTLEADETAAKLYVDWFGDDNLVFSTDFPHPDSKFPNAVESVLKDIPISEESKRKILWDNCVRLYHLPT